MLETLVLGKVPSRSSGTPTINTCLFFIFRFVLSLNFVSVCVSACLPLSYEYTSISIYTYLCTWKVAIKSICEKRLKYKTKRKYLEPWAHAAKFDHGFFSIILFRCFLVHHLDLLYYGLLQINSCAALNHSNLFVYCSISLANWFSVFETAVVRFSCSLAISMVVVVGCRLSVGTNRSS